MTVKHPPPTLAPSRPEIKTSQLPWRSGSWLDPASIDICHCQACRPTRSVLIALFGRESVTWPVIVSDQTDFCLPIKDKISMTLKGNCSFLLKTNPTTITSVTVIIYTHDHSVGAWWHLLAQNISTTSEWLSLNTTQTLFTPIRMTQNHFGDPLTYLFNQILTKLFTFPSAVLCVQC